jgi:hypothetical protein
MIQREGGREADLIHIKERAGKESSAHDVSAL